MTNVPAPFVCIICGDLYISNKFWAKGLIGYTCPKEECRKALKERSESKEFLKQKVLELQSEVVVVCENAQCRKHVTYNIARFHTIDKVRHYYCSRECNPRKACNNEAIKNNVPHSTHCDICNTEFVSYRKYIEHLNIPDSPCSETIKRNKYLISLAKKQKSNENNYTSDYKETNLDVLQNFFLSELCMELNIPLPDTCVNVSGFLLRFAWKDIRLCVCFDNIWTFSVTELNMENLKSTFSLYGYTYMNIPWKACFQNSQSVKDNLLRAYNIAKDKQSLSIYVREQTKMKCFNYVPTYSKAAE